MSFVRSFPQLFYANLSSELFVKMIVAISKFNYDETVFFHTVMFQFQLANTQHEQIAELIINIPHALKIEKIMLTYPELLKTKLSDESYVKMIIAVSKFNNDEIAILNDFKSKHKQINIPYEQLVELVTNIPNCSYYLFTYWLDLLIAKCIEPISEKRNEETIGMIKRMSKSDVGLKQKIQIVDENKTLNDLDNKTPIVNESNVEKESSSIPIANESETSVQNEDTNKTPIVEVQQNVTNKDVENKDVAKQINCDIPNNVKIDVLKNADKLEIIKLKNRIKSLDDKLAQCLKCINKNDKMLGELENTIDEKDDEIDFLKTKIESMEKDEIENIKSFGKIINNLGASIEMKHNTITYMRRETINNVD